jgi:2-polyprenyl-3-methyl-5-hydroxy-6-metoxy-1,4-benzoquinol methylase
VLEPHKQAEIDSAAGPPDRKALHKPFGEPWRPYYFVKWATIVYALRALPVKEGASILDVGAGSGWTTVFLAESGYRPTWLDIAPGHLEAAKQRAERYGVSLDFTRADMDDFDLGQQFDACLVFDALHHSTRQREVVKNIAAHLSPGGWALFGEPSILHKISPHARRTTASLGWTERGISVRELKRDCRSAGLIHFRRFYEGVGPLEARTMPWQLARLAGQVLAVAPQASVWLAAQRP